MVMLAKVNVAKKHEVFIHKRHISILVVIWCCLDWCSRFGALFHPSLHIISEYYLFFITLLLWCSCHFLGHSSIPFKVLHLLMLLFPSFFLNKEGFIVIVVFFCFLISIGVEPPGFRKLSFKNFWGWRIFQLLMLPGRLMYHRSQEDHGAQSYLSFLPLQAHLDLREIRHDHLWQFQGLQADLRGKYCS